MRVPDILGPGLDVIFCGTAAGKTSAAFGHYYARPGNRFWQVLAEVGLTPRRLNPADDVTLPGYGIGLTDLAKQHAGADQDIPDHAFQPDVLSAILARWQPRAVAFNGLKAARVATGNRTLEPGLAMTRISGCAIWILPSTSGLATRWWNPAPWNDLAAWVQGRQP